MSAELHVSFINILCIFRHLGTFFAIFGAHCFDQWCRSEWNMFLKNVTSVWFLFFIFYFLFFTSHHVPCEILAVDPIAHLHSKRPCAVVSHQAAHSLQDQFQKGNGNFEATDIETGLTSHSGISHISNRGYNSGGLDAPPTSRNILIANDCPPQMVCAQKVCKSVAVSHGCDTSEMLAEDGRRTEATLAPLTAE